MTVLSAIANGAVWGIALTAAVWIVLRLTPRPALNAAARYWIWWLTFAAILALPVAARRAPLKPAIHSIEGRAAASGLPHIERVLPPPAPLRPWQPVSLSSGSWETIARTVWIAFAALMLLRLALAVAAISGARRRALAAPEPWPQALQAWLRRVQAGSRRVRLASSADISIPAACGPLHPTILIPAQLFSALSPEDVHRVGLHEAAHLARRDDVTLLAQRILQAALWPHPAVWLISRELDTEREIACDDRVVSATGEARDYAGCLTRLVATCGAIRGGLSAPAIADSRSRLSRRVHLLLGSRGAASRLPMRIAAVAAPLALVALAFAKAPAVIAVSAPIPLPAFTLIQQPEPPAPPTVAVKENPMPHRLRRIVQAAALASAAAVSIPAADAQPAATAQETRLADRPFVVLFFPTALLDRYQLQNAVDASRKYIAERKGALIAVLSFGGSIAIKHDFTDDPGVLNATLDKIAVQPPGSSAGATDRYLVALYNVIRMLGALPNKKALVYFASGDDFEAWAPAPQPVIDEAIRNNVALFPIDVRGLNGKGN
jgi:beta-lactamase regulating signal transducer with metallopeptidase domain